MNDAAIKALVEEQANDERLWFWAGTCAEAYVQQALRKLHAAIEGKSPEECARQVLGTAGSGRKRQEDAGRFIMTLSAAASRAIEIRTPCA